MKGSRLNCKKKRNFISETKTIVSSSQDNTSIATKRKLQYMGIFSGMFLKQIVLCAVKESIREVNSGKLSTLHEKLGNNSPFFENLADMWFWVCAT